MTMAEFQTIVGGDHTFRIQHNAGKADHTTVARQRHSGSLLWPQLTKNRDCDVLEFGHYSEGGHWKSTVVDDVQVVVSWPDCEETRDVD